MHGGLDGELARLEIQAALMWAAERRLLEEWGLADGTVIADLGCGSGALLTRLAGAAPRAVLIGVDHDPRLLVRASEAVPQAELVWARLETLPLADGSVSLAVLRLVVQHLDDPGSVLREARRVVAPGGRLVIFDVDGGLWGIAEPTDPVLAGLQARAWTSRPSGGERGNRPSGGERGNRPPRDADRMIGRRLHRLLVAAGFADVGTRLYSYSTDELGLDALAPLLDPVHLMPLVEAGAITPVELARAVGRFREWCARPDAYALLVGFAGSGSVPDRPVGSHDLS